MKRCLIISVNALGDTYLSLSALPALKDMDVDLITTSGFESYVKYFNLNKVFLLKEKSFWGVIDAGTDILDIQYDYVFSFFPGRINSFFFNISKSQIKCGYVNYFKMPEWHNKNSKLTLRGIEKQNYIWSPDDNFLDRIYYSLHYAGLHPPELVKIPFQNFQPEHLNEKFIVCNFSSRIDSKSMAGYAAQNIIEILTDVYRGKIFVLTGEDSYFQESRKVSLIRYTDTINLLNHIIGTEVFIGVDSFPLHIADAYNKKIIGLFSDTNPNSVFQNPADKVGLKNPEINHIKPEDIINSLKILSII